MQHSGEEKEGEDSQWEEMTLCNGDVSVDDFVEYNDGISKDDFNKDFDISDDDNDNKYS